MKIREFRLKLYPKDFDTLKDFYTKTLQFPVIEEWDHGPTNRGVMMNVGGTTLELLSLEDTYKTFAGFGLSLEVENVQNLWEELRDKLPIGHPIRHNPWGDTSFEIIDPEGLKITFFTKD